MSISWFKDFCHIINVLLLIIIFKLCTKIYVRWGSFAKKWRLIQIYNIDKIDPLGWGKTVISNETISTKKTIISKTVILNLISKWGFQKTVIDISAVRGHSNNTWHFLDHFRPLPHVTFCDMVTTPPPGVAWNFVFLSFEAWYGNQAQPEQVKLVIRCEILLSQTIFCLISLENFVSKLGEKCHVTLCKPPSPPCDICWHFL